MKAYYYKTAKKLQLNKINYYDVAYYFVTVFLFLIGFLLFTFSSNYIKVDVIGTSMQPTINNYFSQATPNYTDTAFINTKAGYQKGDIIVIDRTNQIQKYVIKRLIATENDTVNILYNNQTEQVEVYVNNELLIENYVVYKEGLQTTLNNFNLLKQNSPELFNDLGELVVPKGEIFYLGDNRAESSDSSTHGTISAELISGKVDIVIPYGESFLSVMFDYIEKFIPPAIKTAFTSSYNWLTNWFNLVFVIAILSFVVSSIYFYLYHTKKRV